MPTNATPATARTENIEPLWPAKGLRLGRCTDGLLDIAVAMGPKDELLGVPVHLRDRRWRLHRPGGSGPDEVQKHDLGTLIPRWPHAVPRRIDTALWHEAGRVGVLFVVLNGTGRLSAPDPATLVEHLNAMLRDQNPANLQLSIMPTVALPASCLNAPHAATGRSMAVQAAAVAPTEAPEAATEPRLRIVLGSCQYTVGFLDGTPEGDAVAPGGSALTPGPGDASFARLAKRLEDGQWRRPDALILTGDQVYVDATAGLFDPEAVSGRHEAPYERLLESRAVRDVLRQLPLCALIDDHEIVNNYEPVHGWLQNRRLQEQLVAGRRAYIRQQRQVSLLRPLKDTDTELWDSIRIAGFDFFMADTRTERERRDAGSFGARPQEPAPHILGSAQRVALIEWLMTRDPDRPCFVVSPSTFLPRKLQTLESDAAALRSDAWDGYPASMHCVLDVIAQARCKVVFLSGDEHRCLLSRATLEDDPGVAVHSVHSSALYAPYPFANARPEDFALPDRGLRTATGRPWSVSGEVLPRGDGFCVIDVARDDQGWRVDVQFDLSGLKTPLTRTFRP